MKKKYMTRRRANAIVASALALTLAIPSTSLVGNVPTFADDDEDVVELPDPIATYDFERGFKEGGYDASGDALKVTQVKSDTIWKYKDSKNVSGASVVNWKNTEKTEAWDGVVSNQPFINDDEERGNVLTLQDAITTKEAFLDEVVSVDASGNGVDANGNKVEKTNKTVTTAQSKASIANPFAGRTDLTEDARLGSTGRPVWSKGVTISYWVKTPKAASGESVSKDSGVLLFRNDKIKDAVSKDDMVKVKANELYEASPESVDFSLGEKAESATITYHSEITPVYTEDGVLDVKAEGDHTFEGWKYSIVVDSVTDASGNDIKSSGIADGFDKINSNECVLRGYSQQSYGSSVLSGGAVINNPWNQNKNGQPVSYIPTNRKGYTTAEGFKGAGFTVPTAREYFGLYKVGDYIYSTNAIKFTCVQAADPNAKDASGNAVSGEGVKFESEQMTEEMNIYKNVGKYAIMNPEFPAKNIYLRNAEGALVKAHGWGAQNALVTLLDATGDAVTDASGNAVQYPKWSTEFDGTKQSPVRRALEDDNAFLRFSLSGNFAYAESTRAIRATKNDGSGETTTMNFHSNNQLVSAGSENSAASPIQSPDTWTFVTYVIQNDRVDTYYDGELVNAELYNNNKAFGNVHAAKEFNKGFGPNCTDVTNPKWTPKDDLMTAGYTTPAGELPLNSNTFATSIMDVLTSEDTVLELGGIGEEGALWGSGVDSAYGTSIDDLKFFDEPMTDEQVAELYKQATTAEEKEVAPIASYHFEVGDTVTPAAANAGKNNRFDDPTVVTDEALGSALKLGGGNTGETCAAKLDNPYKGMREITGVSVSYWIKEEATDRGTMNDTPIIAFYNETKEALNHEKLQSSYVGEMVNSILYVSTAGGAVFKEGYSNQNASKSMCNNYLYTTSGEAILADADQWHYMTMVATNSGIKVYRDGEILENINTEVPGGRFFDGYYEVMKDHDPAESIAEGEDKLAMGGTNNQGAMTLLGYLNKDITDVYLGFATAEGTDDSYMITNVIYMNDIDFYDVALTDEQVKAIYDEVSDNGEDVKLGDVNGDDKVNSDDAVIVLKYFAGLKDDEAVKAMNMEAADVNGDDKVNSDDAVEILKNFAGLPSVLDPKTEPAE